MATITGLRSRLQRMSVVEVCENAVDNTLEDIADAQRKQMRDGGDREGEPIGDGMYDSRGYYFYKRNLPTYDPKYGEIDLYNTGAFQRKIVANLIGDEIIIESTDSKAAEITGKYGRQIWGLADEYRVPYIRKSLFPSVSREIFQATGLKANG